MILHRNNAGACFAKQPGGNAADIAKALHRDARALDLQSFAAASQPTTNTPRPVAPRRPRLPPKEIGLPVTTPEAVML